VSQAEETGGTIERMLALKALPVLADLDPDEVAAIAEHARFCSFARGETLFAGARTPVTSMHLVLEGRVVEQRGDRIFRTHGPQRVVGGVDALARSVADVVATADEDTRTLAIERDDLREVLEDNFGVLSAALQGVAASALAVRHGLAPHAGFPAPLDAGRDDGVAADELGTRIAFLAQRTWLCHARVRTIGQLAREAEWVKLADGVRLWAERDPSEQAVVIVTGRVACVSEDRRHAFEVGPGTVVGLEETLAGEPRWTTASARGPVSGLLISRAVLLDVLEDDPDSALEVLAAFAGVASTLRDAAARVDGTQRVF
jgi:CRP-like cAMP-binding protein